MRTRTPTAHALTHTHTPMNARACAPRVFARGYSHTPNPVPLLGSALAVLMFCTMFIFMWAVQASDNDLILSIASNLGVNFLTSELVIRVTTLKKCIILREGVFHYKPDLLSISNELKFTNPVLAITAVALIPALVTALLVPDITCQVNTLVCLHVCSCFGMCTSDV